MGEIRRRRGIVVLSKARDRGHELEGCVMRLPWQKRPDEHVDPHRPHEFRSESDSGIGAITPIGGGVGREVANIATANAYMRTVGCAVPGCGQSRDALIHAPEE
jgi:hypothetical protein